MTKKIQLVHRFQGKAVYGKTSLEINESLEGETIEMKVDRILNNGEPISDGTATIFTERKDGVLPEYDIRTDRQEVAIGAMDVVSKSRIAKREDGISKRQEALEALRKKEKGEPDDQQNGAGGQSTHGTDKNP